MARRDDCAALMTLIRELADFERASSEVAVSPGHFEQAGFGPEPVWWALVAEVNGLVVGFGLCYTRYSTWKGRLCYLEDLVVTERMRGKGIGHLLFVGIREEARKRGYPRLCWQVLDWNLPAIRFYQKFDARFDDGWTNGWVDI